MREIIIRGTIVIVALTFTCGLFIFNALVNPANITNPFKLFY